MNVNKVLVLQENRIYNIYARVYVPGPIMFVAYAIYIIARKLMIKRGFMQVSSDRGA
jgi:hypothetical protein